MVVYLEQGADCLRIVQLMPQHPKALSSLASFKSRLVLPFWYRINQVVLEKRPLNGCSTTELYILWSELSWDELSPTLAATHYSCPDNTIGLVAQCELSGYVKLGWLLEAVGQTWQPCHSWSGKMAVRWRHCGL